MPLPPEVVVKLLSAAVAAGVKPFVEGVKSALRRRGMLRAASAVGRSLQIPGPHRTGFATLAGLENLPPGLSYAQIKLAVDTPTFRAYASQIVATHILETSHQVRSRIFDALSGWMSAATGATVSTQLVAYLTKFNTALDAACADVASQLRRDMLDSGETVHQWALAQISQSLLESIDRHVTSVARTDGASIKEAEKWVSSYKREFEALHSEIPLFDIGPRRRVHLRDIFVEPDFLTVFTSGTAYANPLGHEIALPFEAFLEDLHRTVIVGNPGAGKSTATAALSVIWSKTRGVAFYLRARELQLDGSGFNLIQEIERTLSSIYQHKPPNGLVEEFLLNGSAIVVLDGLDEIPMLHRRRQVAGVIESAQRLFPLCRFLVSARIVGYSAFQLDPEIFTDFTIQPFRLDQVKLYVEKWFRLTTQPNTTNFTTTVRDFVRSSDSIHDLRTNPLMLALICVLYRGYSDIPRRRPQIYRKCIELLLRDWDLSRGITVRPWETDMYELALSAIAEILADEYRFGITHDRLLAQTFEALRFEAIPNSTEASRVAADIVEFCRDRGWIFTKIGLDDAGNEIYSFTHRSFFEYFAAYRMTRTSDSPKELADRIFEVMKAGEGEVLAQIALIMYGERNQFGGSKTMLELLELARRASATARGPALEFIIAAADAVMLNQAALSALVRDAIELEVPEESLRSLFLPTFRYADGMEEILVDCLRKYNQPDLYSLTIRHEWLWDVAVQHGLLPIDALTVDPDEPISSSLGRLLGGDWSDFSDRAPASTAVGILNAAADPEFNKAQRASAFRTLRFLGRSLGDLSGVDGLLRNILPSKKFDQFVMTDYLLAESSKIKLARPTLGRYVDVAEAAIGRSIGFGYDAVLGAIVLVLCVCEMIEERYRVTEYPRTGLVAHLLQRRAAFGRVEEENPLADALTPSDATSLERWCMQKIAIIHYDIVSDAISS